MGPAESSFSSSKSSVQCNDDTAAGPLRHTQQLAVALRSTPYPPLTSLSRQLSRASSCGLQSDTFLAGQQLPEQQQQQQQRPNPLGDAVNLAELPKAERLKLLQEQPADVLASMAAIMCRRSMELSHETLQMVQSVTALPEQLSEEDAVHLARSLLDDVAEKAARRIRMARLLALTAVIKRHKAAAAARRQQEVAAAVQQVLLARRNQLLMQQQQPPEQQQPAEQQQPLVDPTAGSSPASPGRLITPVLNPCVDAAIRYLQEVLIQQRRQQQQRVKAVQELLQQEQEACELPL